MNESFNELHDLAGEYVLGTLDPARRDAVMRRLPAEPLLRSAVEEWERRLLPLTTLAEAQDPSPHLWPRIAKSLQPRKVTDAGGWRRWWDNLHLWRGLAAGGILAASVFGAMVVTRQAAPTAEPAFMVVLVGPQDQAPGWVVQASLDRNLTLTPLHPVAVPGHKSLQFWTKGENWQGPVSLGLVPAGKSRHLTLEKLPPLQANQLFEITLEPETGSATGKPSGPVLFIGKAVKVM